MPVIIRNLKTNFEIENLDEFNAFSTFNIFMKRTMPHIDLKSKLLNNENLGSYTYQDFVDYLSNKFWDFLRPRFTHKERMKKWNDYFLPLKPEGRYIKLNEKQDKVFTDGKNILKLLIAKNENCEEYIEYCLPIYWYDELKILPCNYYDLCEKFIFNKFNYPNMCIETNELKKGQPQQNTYSLILEKIKDHLHGKEELFKMLSLDFITPDKPLKKGHNIVNVNIKVADFKFQVDFHIKLID